MKEAFQMLQKARRQCLQGSIFSQALADGSLPSSLPECPSLKAFGAEAVRASRSQLRGSEMDSRMKETYGPHSSGSLESQSLQLLLENNLKRQSNMVGSTVYAQTWKAKATPAARRYLAHTARRRRINETGFIGLVSGYQTPRSEESTGDKRKSGKANLQMEAKLVALGQAQTSSNAKTDCELPLLELSLLSAAYRLNMAFVRWLMGYPEAWDCAAILTTLKSKRQSAKTRQSQCASTDTETQ
jgi:hypothetical protein